MNLNERINADFMIAFKAKQMGKKNFLGVIRGEIQTQVGKGLEPNDQNITKIVKKIEKSLLQGMAALWQRANSVSKKCQP